MNVSALSCHMKISKDVHINVSHPISSSVVWYPISPGGGLWFFHSHVWMWESDYKESWAPKNWCFWTVMLEKTLESSLECKIQTVNLKGNQLWIFIGRTDAKADAPILGPPDVKIWLTGKDPDTEKDWRQEEKGRTEDKMIGWYHQLEPGFGSWWWTGRPDVLQSMESQRVRHDWVTELNR